MRYFEYTIKPFLNQLFDKYYFKNKCVKFSDLEIEEQNKLLFYSIEYTEMNFNDLDMSKVENNLKIFLVSNDKKDKEIMADSLINSCRSSFAEFIDDMILNEFHEYTNKKEIDERISNGMTSHADDQTGEIIWK